MYRALDRAMVKPLHIPAASAPFGRHKQGKSGEDDREANGISQSQGQDPDKPVSLRVGVRLQHTHQIRSDKEAIASSRILHAWLEED